MTIKEQIHKRLLEIIQDRIDVFQDMIINLSIDSQNDAKGSAGDKHETALSMMHIEQEKLNFKVTEYRTQYGILIKINPLNQHNTITLGSLIETNGILLYMSTALPKISINSKTIFAISPQSPLGSKLMGNSVGYSFELNKMKYIIQSVV